MNYTNLTKKLFLSFSIIGLLVNAEPSKSGEWQENAEAVSCTTGHADMSDAALGADHSKPFSITSNAMNPHKACLQTPEGYKITLFNIGMCTSNPFDDNNDNVDLAFTEANGCVWTMESVSGVEVDLAANLNQAIALPSASTRPPSGTFTHFIIVMNPNIKLKGSYTTTDNSNGGTFYTKPGSSSVDSEGEFDSSLTSSQFFTADFSDALGFNNRDSCRYSYQRTISSGSNQGIVRAVLTNDALETQTACSGVTRLVGDFKATTPLVINDDTNGLEIQFSITGAGLMVEGGGGGAPVGFTCNNPDPLVCHPRASHNQPIYGYAGDFQPVFSKF
tara:strand:- start:163 stop:1161 length:999 start_codon:yes stop_codon:yes gene_type:complete